MSKPCLLAREHQRPRGALLCPLRHVKNLEHVERTLHTEAHARHRGGKAELPRLKDPTNPSICAQARLSGAFGTPILHLEWWR